MKRKILILLCIFAFSANIFAQDAWKKWHGFDFSKQLVKRTELTKMEHYDLQILRGILFGKRGRIFVENDIQDYLSKQSWYKPNKNYKNSVLTANERKNIDLIREAEAASHDFVEPGDLRWWKTKPIPTDKIYAATAADWEVLIAEIEAIHGKTFPENEWLQKYFDDRYWYKRNANYDASILNANERKNLQAFIEARNKERKVAVSPGDMDKFQNASLKPEMLNGLTLNELRVIRNEFFARRGKRFSTPGYRSFYEWQSWYKPLKDQTKVKLNSIEEANVKTIEAVEKKIREGLTTDELTEEMVGGLFVEDLRVLRNEIFARHGYIFKDAELQKTFEATDWYKPDATFTTDKISTVLSTVELKNISTIKKAEEVAVSKLVEVEG